MSLSSRIHIRGAGGTITSLCSLSLDSENESTVLGINFCFFFFFLDSRAVGDFRAEFCNKPIARTSRSFGLILRRLIHRAVYCTLFFKRRKKGTPHEVMRVQSLDLRGETPAPFCFRVSVPSGSCPIQYRRPSKTISRKGPKKTISTWFAVAAS